MTTDQPFRKTFPGVATGKKMFELLNPGADLPIEQRIDGTAYAGAWFEITQADYAFMLDILPPLFMRTGMFGMSEFKAGNVTSVFFGITIHGRRRWFHGFCDMSDRFAPDRMRAAIIAFEWHAFDSMTRAEKLEAIWILTPDDFKGTAEGGDAAASIPHQRDERAIIFDHGEHGTVTRPLDDLTDNEIADLLRPFTKGEQR
ncbi:DUF1419 domain-containing protein [Chelativorans sp. AA-79]|uniref:DUF1419 domain-containing protein n=1 Tax=Chelativorans sp. AA-79 TaxID=3028735 RepID=UPI0023F9DF44|nr:DUF1419 domain-containing protein [Chelativorans sp. AA-79]WEX12373.1 DUF1419 domain-containing protein [Chelativorans sp. AA-79]